MTTTLCVEHDCRQNGGDEADGVCDMQEAEGWSGGRSALSSSMTS